MVPFRMLSFDVIIIMSWITVQCRWKLCSDEYQAVRAAVAATNTSHCEL